jgi:hypothetical protein
LEAENGEGTFLPLPGNRAGQGISKNFFNSNSNIKGLEITPLNLENTQTDTVLILKGVETLKSNNLNYRFSHIHSYLISILTCTILLYAIKPTLLLNLTSILAFYAFSI